MLASLSEPTVRLLVFVFSYYSSSSRGGALAQLFLGEQRKICTVPFLLPSALGNAFPRGTIVRRPRREPVDHRMIGTNRLSFSGQYRSIFIVYSRY